MERRGQPGLEDLQEAASEVEAVRDLIPTEPVKNWEKDADTPVTTTKETALLEASPIISRPPEQPVKEEIGYLATTPFDDLPDSNDKISDALQDNVNKSE